MAKPTKNALLICIITSVIALIGIIIGFYTKKPLVAVILLLPTVVYEVYRVEGASTKAASWLLLVVLILEIVFIAARINFDLASLMGASSQSIQGYHVPLGDIKTVSPALMAVLSLILYARTYGIYTKWLAITILITSIAIIIQLDSSLVAQILQNINR